MMLLCFLGTLVSYKTEVFVFDKGRLNSQNKDHVTMHKLYIFKMKMKFLHNLTPMPSFLEWLLKSFTVSWILWPCLINWLMKSDIGFLNSGSPYFFAYVFESFLFWNIFSEHSQGLIGGKTYQIMHHGAWYLKPLFHDDTCCY